MPNIEIDPETYNVYIDGERVTVVEFKDQESQKAWASQMEHVAAKQRGREAFYAEYAIQVCEVLRESRFVAPEH